MTGLGGVRPRGAGTSALPRGPSPSLATYGPKQSSPPAKAVSGVPRAIAITVRTSRALSTALCRAIPQKTCLMRITPFPLV